MNVKNLIKNLLNKINFLKTRTSVIGFTWGAGFNSAQDIRIYRCGQIINIYLWLETTTNLTGAWKTVLSGLPSTDIDATAFFSTATFQGQTVLLRVTNNELQARSSSNSSMSYSGYVNIMYIAGNNN